MADEKKTNTKLLVAIIVAAIGLPVCGCLGFFGLGVISGVLQHRRLANPTPMVVWSSDADGCPETCRRAGECHLERFLGEACVASCESGADVYQCLEAARSCADMELCR